MENTEFENMQNSDAFDGTVDRMECVEVPEVKLPSDEQPNEFSQEAEAVYLEATDDTVEDGTGAQEESVVDDAPHTDDGNIDQEPEKIASQEEFVEPISGALPSSSSGAPEFFEEEGQMMPSLLPEKDTAPGTNEQMSISNPGNEMPVTTASRRESVGSNGSTPPIPCKPWGEDELVLPAMAPERIAHTAVKVRKTKVPKRNVPAKNTLARKAPIKMGRNVPSTKRTSKVMRKSTAITIKGKGRKAAQARKTKNLKSKKAVAKKVTKRTGRSKTNAKITAKAKSLLKKSAKRVKKTIGKAKNTSKARRA